MSFMDADLARSGLVPADLHSIEMPNPFAPTTSLYRIPYWLPDGTQHPFMYRERLQMPREGGKYSQPSKAQAIAAGRLETDVTYPYLCPTPLQRVYHNVRQGLTWAQVAALPAPTNNGKLFCIVEGEKKAVAVGLFCGRLAIGIGGCWNGVLRDRDGAWDIHPAFLEIIQPGDRVEIVFDADLRTNHNVEVAAGSLRRALIRHQIRVSFVVVPPTVKGIDDWLMAHPIQDRPAAFDHLPRLTLDRGELQEDRHSLISYLGLPLNDKLGVICNEASAGRVIDQHERYRERIWIEDSEGTMYETVTGDKPAPVADTFIEKQAKWFQAHINHSFAPAKIKNAFNAIAADAHRHRNAVHDYINGLRWDFMPRLEEMFIRGWGADDSPYHREVGKAWMVGLVARAFRPGCDMQTMLILEGPQGIGKSRSLKAIGGAWYIEALDKMDSKDFLLSAHRSLIFDLAELGAYKYADFAFVKGLISTAVDHLRVPYGRLTETRPRRFVIVGTTNEELYLRDLTGNRRFWPISCGKLDMDWIVAHRDQLYAEAKVRLDAGAEWWIDDRLTKAVQDARVAHDPWEDTIETVILTVMQSPGQVLVLNSVPYHFVATELILNAVSMGGNPHAGHYQRLHSVMRKAFPDWEPYRYDNKTKPLNIGGVMKDKVRGFRMPVANVSVAATPLPTATVTALSSKPRDSGQSDPPTGNPFMQ